MPSRESRKQPPGRGQRPTGLAPPRVQSELEEAERLFQRRRLDEALAITTSLAAQHRRVALVQSFHGSLLAQKGDLMAATKHLEEAVRLDPSLSDASYSLAQAYLKQVFIARAIQAARRYLRVDPQGDVVAEVRQILAGAEKLIVETAAELGVPAATMERASLLNELAQEALEYQDFRTAVRLARDSARLVPRWPSPRNNRAVALLLSGQVADAILTLERLLSEVDGDNIYAISNLVQCYDAVGDTPRTEEHLRRLERLPAKSTADWEKMAEAFASLDRDQEVYDLLKHAERGAEPLRTAGLRLLAIAAANLGRWQEALAYAQAMVPKDSQLTQAIAEASRTESR